MHLSQYKCFVSKIPKLNIYVAVFLDIFELLIDWFYMKSSISKYHYQLLSNEKLIKNRYNCDF